MHFRSIENRISLTGSGEVHNPLGSFKLPRRLDCLPDLRWPALGNWGIER